MSNSPEFSAPQVAALLGVGPDVVRRWCDEGVLASSRTPGGQRSIAGAAVAAMLADTPPAGATMPSSARNQFRGIVTHVECDGVAARVELRSGDHRIVSLMTSESVEELGLRPGVVAVASMKSTNVTVELER